MLECRTYPRRELIEIFGTKRIDSIKGKLKRRGYEFESHGRGETYEITITKQPPDRFRDFCIDELGIAPQTDFEKLKTFYSKFFFDEEFRSLPQNGMKDIILQNTIITNPTITSYVRNLYKNEMIQMGDPLYYSCNKFLGLYTPITEKQYKKAWAIYWELRNSGAEYHIALNEMCSSLGGFPVKTHETIFNAFELGKIEELEKLLLEE